MSFIWYILIGLVSGAVAGKLMRGGGFGWVVNLVVGIIGGVLGGWLFGILGIHTSSIIGNLITSVVGAIFLLWIVGFLSKMTR
ncbi:MAG: GlsB/YeaQ/YmgE family stress response membrane protein [Bacteroides sp.]|nr:GlsB/YeaQ/YmgE family stress response membrane protein [Bacteroides sp.]